MGREAKLLLALLGLLTGVLVGVVSMKLFVPRPPVGAGPDIHGAVTATEVQELVEPPALSLTAGGDYEPAAAARPASRFTPVAEFAPEPFSSEPQAEIAAIPHAFRESVPDPPPLQHSPPPPEPPAARDPFVSPASLEVERSRSGADTDLLPPPADLAPPGTGLPGPPRAVSTPPADYVAKPGDSWWSLAERTYGDGRLYRALFAWNRARDPRISLVPGMRLELPAAERLATAWPGLMPRE